MKYKGDKYTSGDVHVNKGDGHTRGAKMQRGIAIPRGMDIQGLTDI